MDKRLFLGIFPDNPALDQIAEYQKRLVGINEHRLVRWTKPATWHVTMLFIGDFPTKGISQLANELKTIGPLTPCFDYNISGLRFFPSPTRPRVLWLGATPAERFARLHLEIRKAIRPFIKTTSETFKPHITLGRIRPESDRDLVPLLLQKIDRLDPPPNIPQQATVVKLMESQLTPAGSIYRTLDEIEFAAKSMLN